MNLHRSLRLRRAVLAVGFALAALSPESARAEGADTAQAGAEPKEVEQARRHFGQGLKLYKDGDFDAALVQFERAYAVKPNFKVLYNIAQCYFELHQYVEARDTLSRYLKDGAGSIEADRQTSVQNDLSELQRRIAHLTLQVNVAGANVFVDGKKAGTTPLGGPIDVNEGQRTISVETMDRGTKQRIVRLAGGEEQTVSLDFALPSAVPTTAAPANGTGNAKAPATHGLGAGFWLTGGLAVALGAGAGVTGYFALRAQDDHDQDRRRFGITTKDLNDSRDRAKTFALTTDILAGSAIVCASIATVLLVTHDSGDQQLGLAVGPGNLALSGNF